MEATSAVNGASVIDLSTPSSRAAGPGRQQANRSPYGMKTTDSTRKQPPGAQDDGSQKRTPIKAWTGVNPITNRANAPTQSNGIIQPTRSTNSKPAVTQESKNVDKTGSDNVSYMFAKLLGLHVELSTKHGEAFTGIFAGASLQDAQDSSVLLKFVQQTSRASPTTNGASSLRQEYIGIGSEHSMSFGLGDMAGIYAKQVPEPQQAPATNGASSGFRTDVDISGNLAVRERNLQRWVSPSGNNSDTALESLESTTGDYDQFKVNEQRFGVRSDYDENFYTTHIDRSNPLYSMRAAEADRIAREIEGQQTNNVHIREERGHQDDDEVDEEEKYSGVRRNAPDYAPLQTNQPNTYTPPARRSAVPKPALGNSSVDPAIISAQIARPGSKPKEQKEQKETQTVAIEKTVATATDSTQGSIPRTAEPIAVEAKPASSTKAVNESAPRPALPIASKILGSGATATENVEIELLDSFRQFANAEKLKWQDTRRSRASADKMIKFNDLVKFSQNFKLLTPIPKDLVPILAKDKVKQDDLVEKAQKISQTAAAAKATPAQDPKAPRAFAPARWEGEPSHLNAASSRNRQNVPQQPAAGAGNVNKPNQGMLSHRLADSHRAHKLGAAAGTVPSPLPIQDARATQKRPSIPLGSTPSPQHFNSIRSPTSATSGKLNVKAMEFRPNPNANSFRPTDPSVASSPRSGLNTRPVSRPPSPSEFFGDRKPVPLSERPSILDNFNPLKFLRAEAKKVPKDGKAPDYSKNGGIPPAYKTPPTWNPPKDGEEWRSYKDTMVHPRSRSSDAVSQHTSPSHAPLAHQHQLPPHLQGNGIIPQVHAPTHIPPHMPPHHHTYGGPAHQYDDHHMRPSASNSSVFPAPSPRVQTMNIAYPSPMTQQAQLAYGQHLPGYVMGPNGPQPIRFAQFPGGPQMLPQGPHLAAPMMVPQNSSGGGGMMAALPQQMGIPFNPLMGAIYQGGNPQAYGGAGQHQTPNNSGYPSPRAAAPMMMHQGSHQGQHHPVYMAPGQYGQPMYAQGQPTHMTPMRGYASPQPHYVQNTYPHQYQQPHRTPSNGYGQVPQMAHHQHMNAQQAPPHGGPPMDMVDSSK
ncbi:hypothetical protein MMC25_002017 [Agyrium rufum]|nr:hypothetical protein [Agyrium rufum]